MGVSQERLEINRKYLNKLEEVKVRVPKGYKSQITKYCTDKYGKSVNQVIIMLLNRDLENNEENWRIPSGTREIAQNSKEE